MLLIGRRALVAIGLIPLACGARSGLHTPRPDVDAAVEAGVDAPECVIDSDCPTADLCSTRVCLEGTCQAPVAVVCDDSNECTSDACVPDTGLCEFKPLSLDQDGDGYNGPRPGYAPGAPGSCGNDCNDTNPAAHPGGIEVCDGVDNDCNGIVDDNMKYVPSGGGDVEISGDHTQAGRGGAAWDGDLYAATYAAQASHWHYYDKGLTPTGGIAFDETAITTSNNDTFGGPIVWTGAIFGTAWEDRRDTNYEIYFNRLGKQGAKLAADLRVTSAGNFSLHPDVLWNGLDFVVMWDDRRAGAVSVWGQLIDVDGKLVGDNVQVTPPSSESPIMAQGSTTLGVVYNAGDAITRIVRFRVLAPDLTAKTDPVVLAQDGATDPVVVWSGDRYVAVWSTRTTVPGDSIWGATIGEDGTIIKPATKVTSGATFARTPSLLALGDRLILVWADDHDGDYEIYSKMLSLDLAEIAPRARITNKAGNSIDPFAVFGPAGDVGVLFDDDRSGAWQAYFTRLVCKAGG